jgi:dihydroorotate dehydrogenase
LSFDVSRRLLFLLEPERAHSVTIGMMSRLPRLSTLPFALPRVSDPMELMGLHFPNRVGLAAGLDKNGECITAMGHLGFGFVEVGTVTPRPQPGNPRPRLFRLPAQQALINRLGFNNKGVDYAVERVRRASFKGVLGINIGKNADTPLQSAEEDYVYCLQRAYEVADYVTINVSSPNTAGLRDLQDSSRLRLLLLAVTQAREALRDTHGKNVPLLVKISPDVSLWQLEDIAHLALELELDGIIAANTTVTRPGLEGEILAQEKGGLSGKPLRPLGDEVLRRLRMLVGPRFPLIGVGGIVSAADAMTKCRNGADLVQIYTGLIYCGPRLVGECAQAIAPGGGGR